MKKGEGRKERREREKADVAFSAIGYLNQLCVTYVCVQ